MPFVDDIQDVLKEEKQKSVAIFRWIVVYCFFAGLGSAFIVGEITGTLKGQPIGSATWWFFLAANFTMVFWFLLRALRAVLDLRG